MNPPKVKPVYAELIDVVNGDAQYQCLKFVCPGCVAGGPDGYEGVHMLPVNCNNHQPTWDWDGNLEKPTLSPSILSQNWSRCHGYLEAGVFRFLEDSEHSLAGKSNIPMVPLPDWAIKMGEPETPITKVEPLEPPEGSANG